MPTVPKTSITTFLILLHDLNARMDELATEGAIAMTQMNDIDYTSVTDLSKGEELTAIIDEMGEKFRKINDMKQTLLNGLQRKVIHKMNQTTPLTKTSSVRSIKKTGTQNSPRKTRRVKTV